MTYYYTSPEISLTRALNPETIPSVYPNLASHNAIAPSLPTDIYDNRPRSRESTLCRALRKLDESKMSGMRWQKTVALQVPSDYVCIIASLPLLLLYSPFFYFFIFVHISIPDPHPACLVAPPSHLHHNM